MEADSWQWLRIFLIDIIIYQVCKKAKTSLHHLAALQGSLSHPQDPTMLEHQRVLIQLAAFHFVLGALQDGM